MYIPSDNSDGLRIKVQTYNATLLERQHGKSDTKYERT